MAKNITSEETEEPFIIEVLRDGSGVFTRGYASREHYSTSLRNRLSDRNFPEIIKTYFTHSVDEAKSIYQAVARYNKTKGRDIDLSDILP
jgi:hypothetical protein